MVFTPDNSLETLLVELTGTHETQRNIDKI